jgi:hypothetical protein
MGRCYEFGVSLSEGCEHAMVVAAEGGRCVCATCGSSCPGQFRACAAIVANPGYVPLTAPGWARPGGSGHPATPLAPRRYAPAVAAEPDADPAVPTAVQHELADLRALVEALLARPDHATIAIEALANEIEKRDDDFAAAFTRLNDAYKRLSELIRLESDARQAISEAVDRLAERVAPEEPSRPIPFMGGGQASG